MELDNKQRAQVLTEALPYIRKYFDKIIVVKYGGNAMINEDLKQAVMGDLVLLSLIGIKVVLVHGGGPEITEMLSKVGKKSEFVDGLRVTDKETVDIVQQTHVGAATCYTIDFKLKSCADLSKKPISELHIIRIEVSCTLIRLC